MIPVAWFTVIVYSNGTASYTLKISIQFKEVTIGGSYTDDRNKYYKDEMFCDFHSRLDNAHLEQASDTEDGPSLGNNFTPPVPAIY